MARSIIIFDRDGTLVDSMGPLVELMSDLFQEEFGVDPGVTKREAPALTMLHPEEMWRAFSELAGADLLSGAGGDNFRRRFADTARKVDTTVFPETHDVLSSLRAHGYRLFMSTSGAMEGLDAWLASAGLNYFELALGTDMLAGMIEGPEHLQRIAQHCEMTPEALATAAVFVGDSFGDMAIAKAAGIPGIGRITLGNEAAMRAAGAVEIIEDLRQLEAAIQRIG